MNLNKYYVCASTIQYGLRSGNLVKFSFLISFPIPKIKNYDGE